MLEIKDGKQLHGSLDIALGNLVVDPKLIGTICLIASGPKGMQWTSRQPKKLPD